MFLKYQFFKLHRINSLFFDKKMFFVFPYYYIKVLLQKEISNYKSIFVFFAKNKWYSKFKKGGGGKRTVFFYLTEKVYFWPLLGKNRVSVWKSCFFSGLFFLPALWKWVSEWGVNFFRKKTTTTTTKKEEKKTTSKCEK